MSENDKETIDVEASEVQETKNKFEIFVKATDGKELFAQTITGGVVFSDTPREAFEDWIENNKSDIETAKEFHDVSYFVSSGNAIFGPYSLEVTIQKADIKVKEGVV